MLRGIYTSGLGMIIQNKKMEVISNNLANVNTNGYKSDSAVFESFDEVLTKRINDWYTPEDPSGKLGNMHLSTDVGQIFTNYQQGKLISTGNKTDLAISNGNNSFFVVNVPGESGEQERYTRDGAFTQDAAGNLVTKEGYAVKGQNGAINLKGGDFQVTAKGEIVQDGKIVDQLMIKTFKDTSNLRKVGDNMVSIEGQAEEKEFDGSIAQGFIESSNVNSIKEMIDMITVVKAYEASQKVIKVEDETLGRAVNDIASLR